MRVFPMYVGVILNWANDQGFQLSIPHVCGGDPALRAAFALGTLVFPMYVGVILTE